MGIALTDLLQDPAAVCTTLETELFGVTVDTHRVTWEGGVVFDLTFAPPPEFATEGYGPERSRISVRRDGTLLTFPLCPRRRWKHRNPSPLGPDFGKLAGDLCLWYPSDPRALRWEWTDGFEQYVTRVHRHLFFEEFWRRTGEWPVEDAPHGEPAHGAHPIRTRRMRDAVKEWS